MTSSHAQVTACCPPIDEQALDDETAALVAGWFKVLADPVRLRLLSLVTASPDGEVCACDLPGLVDRSQPTVSHHLTVLADAGLVVREQRGRWAWFSPAPDRIEVLRRVLG